MDGVRGDTDSMASPVQRRANEAWRLYQYYLDKTTPHAVNRWIGTLVMAGIYFLRVYYVQGFYIITYALGIYVLNLLIGFLSPLVDPELDDTSDGPMLPTKGSDEFKPFIRRLPEFKFWYSMTKAFFIAFVMTFFSFFDIPVFWPILLCYWIALFALTMRRQISHMISTNTFLQSENSKLRMLMLMKLIQISFRNITEFSCSQNRNMEGRRLLVAALAETEA
ncbi:protein RER1A [Eutrema salsugineum]|uniref:protein RER1A n=1 Tax=Eutrema salsugineum TaxID=72664 RepID=UPI000CED54A5|nr:protein RER1A [Eutrema salsugineum]